MIAIDVDVLALLLDLEKTFDTVNHHALLRKFESYGVRGLSWFSNYSSDSSQRVLINNVLLRDAVMDYGVSQGSVLGPLLFLIYMNDFNFTSNSIKLLLWGDDITVYISSTVFWEMIYIYNLICAVNNEWVINN